MYSEDDVLNEWIVRGNVSSEDVEEKGAGMLSFIRQAKQEILDYCNIPAEEDLPPGLFFVWVSLALALYRQDSLAASGAVTTSSQTEGAIKSISEGDTTITYGGAAETSTLIASGVVETPQTVIARYQDQLNHYRRLAW